jgi:hypothetical protein
MVNYRHYIMLMVFILLACLGSRTSAEPLRDKNTSSKALEAHVRLVDSYSECVELGAKNYIGDYSVFEGCGPMPKASEVGWGSL